MIALGWMLFTFLVLLWTAGAWVTAAAARWLAEALASGQATQLAGDVAALPVPEWIKIWIEPSWLQALQGALRWTLDGAGAALPFAATAADWLVPAIWIAWGLGLILLLFAALAAHMLLRRFGRGAARPARVAGTT